MTGPPPAILSIQSRVAYGHVGNGAAVLPLQRLGFEVIALDTVELAHHPGYGSFTGRLADPALLLRMLESLERIGALDACVAVLSGYLGTAETGLVVEAAIERVRRRRPDALYCCDPVIGDEHTGVFVQPGIAEVFRDRLVPAADLLTPNGFELGVLAARPVRGLEDALDAAPLLQGRGAGIVVVTGLPVGTSELGVLAALPDEAWLVRTPRRRAVLHGTGDAFSALLLGHLLAGRLLPDALARAVSAMFVLVERTIAEGGRELALIAAQDAFARPGRRFEARRLR